MKTVNVEIHGLNLSRIIDKMVLNNIALDSVKIKNNTLYFNTNEEKMQKIKDICQTEKKSVTVVPVGLFNKIKYKAARLLGFLLAVIIVFSCLFSYGLFLRKINVVVVGDDDYDVLKITRFLNENDVFVGVIKNKIDILELEKSILKKLLI